MVYAPVVKVSSSSSGLGRLWRLLGGGKGKGKKLKKEKKRKEEVVEVKEWEGVDEGKSSPAAVVLSIGDLSVSKGGRVQVLSVVPEAQRPGLVRQEPFRKECSISDTPPLPTCQEPPLPLSDSAPLPKPAIKSAEKEAIPRRVRFAPLPDPAAVSALPRPQPLEPRSRLLPILKKAEAEVEPPSPLPLSVGSSQQPPQLSWEELRESLPRPRPHPYLHPLALQQKERGKEVKVFAFRIPRVETNGIAQGRGGLQPSQQQRNDGQDQIEWYSYPQAGGFEFQTPALDLGSNNTAVAEPPRPPRGRPRLMPEDSAKTTIPDISSQSKAPEEKEAKGPKDWLFIPDELDELYAGDEWPDL